ncbi:hypothetical protein V501_00059 [Pseudogymnoascus sp. VKM F-4519 (FW-2642)]|nr:hypothetical protein V501_00059 [Pseudogymnoascus sp. VKM F-4519 (FW-2642)]
MDPVLCGPVVESREPAEKKPTRALRRSCEACRASKGRCRLTSEGFGRCQRCVKNGMECVFQEAQPRPKRSKTSRVRVAEMEQRLDDIVGLLSSNSCNSLSVAPSQTQSVARTQVDSRVLQQPGSSTSEVYQPMLGVSAPWLKFEDLQDVIGKGIISINKAEDILQTYGTHAPNFPFVVIPPNMSLDYFRREKPFLLLSILVISSNSNLQFQDRLETELRETLSRKVIINCEKSLDLLQGLMIYLSRYHYYFQPERQQFYQLSQMMIAMAVDLGITRPDARRSCDPSRFASGDSWNCSISASELPSDIEARRIFLGCYYLSSCLSTVFRKPNDLRYNDYVEDCYQTLIEANATPSDFLLPYFVRLQRLAEEVNTTFEYDAYEQPPALDTFRTNTLVKTFCKRLRNFEDSFPSEVWNNAAIKMAQLSLHIYINEVGLYATRSYPFESDCGQTSCREWYSSVARTDSLASCLEATKSFLDRYLMLSNEEMRQNTVMEEMKLVRAILILGRFSLGVDTPHLKAACLRESAQSSYYMEALIQRMGRLISFTDSGHEQMDYFWQIRRIIQCTKNRHDEQTRTGNFTSGLPDSCIDLSFMEPRQLEPDQRDAIGMFPPLAGPAFQEVWATDLLETWSTSTLDPRTM